MHLKALLSQNQRLAAFTSHEAAWRLGVVCGETPKADRFWVRIAGEAPDPCPSVGRRLLGGRGHVETGLYATSYAGPEQSEAM